MLPTSGPIIANPGTAEVDDPTASLPFGREPRIGVLVVAYNAASTLAETLDRIPRDFRPRISEVFVCDDASPDRTYLVGLDYLGAGSDLPVSVVRNERNLGYGGNQKVGYRLAAEHDLDIVVMLHADGQYAPELLPAMVEPLVRGEADAVFGSRMLEKGAARRGGMPAYKLLGNKVLTRIENALLGSDLSEFHSGYRAYNVHTLSELDLSATSDGFNFDTQIIIALHSHGKTIVEIPIPTYYGDEICYVNGLQYAADVVADVAVFKLAQMGFTPGELAQVGDEYDLKESEGSSHTVIQGLVADDRPLAVLDVGCSGGLLGERLRDRGHHVTGVDHLELPGIRTRVDTFHQADLEQGLPEEVGAGYDLAVAADVLEHLRNSDSLLRDMGSRLGEGGRIIISVPNFGHWYPRLRTVLGVFDYDQRGILDKTHLRFFTRRSLLRMIQKNGFDVRRLETTGLPVDVVAGRRSLLKRLVLAVDSRLVRLRPTLFAYQFVVEIEPTPPPRSFVWPRPSR